MKQKIIKKKQKDQIKKISKLYFFFLIILASFISQIIHCIIFYYCRTLFVNIIEGNTHHLLLDIQKYILMFLILCIYGIIMNKLHPIVLNMFISKKKIALLMEDILLGWKYFIILFVLLYKMFFIAYWALALYVLIVSTIILYKKRILTFLIYLILITMHLILYYSEYKYFTSLFMVSYSSIYLAISPCLHTIQRLQFLLKIEET